MSRGLKALKRELANEKAILACAERFGLVGDPTRMKICWLLCRHQELSVSEIAEILDVSVSVVSHSLRRLREHRLVQLRREAKKVFYRLAKHPFTRVLRQSLGVQRV